MTVWENPEFDNHERVTFYQEPESGLVAIHAIHRLLNGRCGGGIRFYPYANSDLALTDVLRLSRAMSYKMVLAGIGLGGGKMVVMGNPTSEKTDEKIAALGRFIDSFDGSYVAGPDVGTTSEDMVKLFEVTPYVAGHSGGSTAVPTAYGVFKGMQAAVKYQHGRQSLDGVSVAVQGVGGVGELLCHHLHKAGAQLWVADLDETAVQRVAQATDATIVPPDKILYQPVDILAPCALGGILNDETIPHIQANIICGGANNQMAAERHNEQVQARGILFAPDYVVNAGGAIGGTTELGILDQDKTAQRLDGIYDTTLQIFNLAEANQQTPNEAAIVLANQRINKWTNSSH